MLLHSIAFAGWAQQSPKEAINKIISQLGEFTATQSAEKLYLQTDKPAYSAGDTLWFKAYLLEASYLHASEKSGVLYVEIANDSNKVIKRVMLPVFSGLSFGNIAFEKDMPSGGYRLRAYTNWMRNFGEERFFEKRFYISQATGSNWLVNYNMQSVRNADNEKVQLKLQLNQLDMLPVALHEMQLKFTDGKRTLVKSNMDTGMDGSMAGNFDLPEKVDGKNLLLTIQNMRKGEGGRKISVPLALNRPDHVDLQFMPEGGNMVAGLPSHIAFKAINEDGNGTSVSGKIFNSKHLEVAAFSSAHKGIGAFDLLPNNGEVYTAQIKFADGSYNTFSLPAVQNSGTILSVNNFYKSDSLEVRVNATADISADNSPHYLIAHARGIVCYGALVHFEEGSRFMINKKLFPSGVVRFTLINAENKALNERIVFIDHDDNLKIKAGGNKAVYSQRDSVLLQIKVTDASGDPVQGSFSLAVTDNGQVKTDSIISASIITQMLLLADLKGTIEDPGYYDHCSANAQKWQHLDQLLLAQGWAAYNWEDAFKPAKPPKYAAEKEFLITGHVTNMFNKPVPNSGITLFSRKPLIIADTVTNTQGLFTFKRIYPADTAVYFIQARNKKGKSYNVGIEMDEFKPPVMLAAVKRIIPWYVNTDTLTLTAVKKQAALKENMEKLTRGTILKEVTIKGKRIIKESKNLNGPGQADQIIDEAELQKAGRMNLGTLLEQRVKGFGVLFDKSGNPYYEVNTMLVHLIIDGMDTEFFHPEGITLYEYFKQYFDYYDAEEIKGIEVMRGSGYAMSYTTRFLKPLDVFYEHTFIEVTTRSGHGPFVKKAVGTFVYRPMSFNSPALFYAPKYQVKTIPDMTDIRSTIYWEPNVIADKNGNATVKFYTADNPGTYTFIIEGTDMQGDLGVKRGVITVKAK